MQPYTPLRILPRGRSTISRGRRGAAFFELGRELFDELLLRRHVVHRHARLAQTRLRALDQALHPRHLQSIERLARLDHASRRTFPRDELRQRRLLVSLQSGEEDRL